MKQVKSVAAKAGILLLVFTALCGIIYPIFITGISQMFFKNKANGSIIEIDGKKYGSVLLEQKFTRNEYLWGRIMNIDTSTFKDDDGALLMYSAPSNLSPASDEYKKLVVERVEKIEKSNPEEIDKAIPVDLVTCSGSGLDPHISVAAAEYQVERIAKSRGISSDEVRKIIKKYTKGRFLGVFGEETVNVLEVNLALDGILK
ncbi:potassium-transporting ATPase subunit KdpC [Clostridium cibarium]|uniref:Potassium-transporting ATPase KdpC subunit n=1 Tax=Clostridium cibarium TaxID=2762247 RepID=A0ABR8PRZ9_9CLOT|nr:potassium-transporting ATPase subunit KdpC [Clostridium cibarium]MBD7910948.1 potassium-transporting ATPase subunit KdpC [Clostridium cibarium]